MSESCIFCRIIRGEIPSHKIYEDERTLAFLDIHHSALGHTRIIPNAHECRIEDLREEDTAALCGIVPRLVAGIQKAMAAPASSVGINNGPESGQEIPHVHIHVIPRNRGDRGGIMQGLVRTTERPSDEELRNIAERIKEKVG